MALPKLKATCTQAAPIDAGLGYRYPALVGVFIEMCIRDRYSVMSTQLKKGREEDPKEELEKGL